MCPAKAICPARQRKFLIYTRRAIQKINQLLQLLTKIFNIIIMARLVSLPKNTHQRDLPEKDKLWQALEFLCKHLKEEPTPTARLFNVKNAGSLQKAWNREKRRKGLKKKAKGG
jgi:hypothetical protein